MPQMFRMSATAVDNRVRDRAMIHAPVTRSECVCSVLNISELAPTSSSASRADTFEPKGAGLVFLRHHPQPLRGMRMRNLARDAPTQGGMIQ